MDKLQFVGEGGPLYHEAVTRVLRGKTLADCIDLLREDVERTGDKGARKGEGK